MSPFLRIGLSHFDCGSCQPCQGEAVNPYCAVLVKEYVESGKPEWGFGGDPAMNYEAKPLRVLQGHLVQPNFTVQETDARGNQVFPRAYGFSDRV